MSAVGDERSVRSVLERLRTNPAEWRRQGAIAAFAQALGMEERAALRSLADEFQMTCWESEQLHQAQPAFDLLPLARSQQMGCALLRTPEQVMTAAVSDPFDGDLLIKLEAMARGPLRFALATPADIRAFLNQQEAQSKAADAWERHDGADEGHAAVPELLSFEALSGASSQTVRLVNAMLYDALRSGASDVHFESTQEGLQVKFRIDGVLDSITDAPGKAISDQVMTRLKVLAELDISESRVPQDGSFRVSAQGRDIDLRVSIMPSVYGEDAVLRILDKQALLAAHGELTLDALGFDPESLGVLRGLLEAPHGMVLVTGPTGSGKTTTLYGALSESRTGREKVITIEDPVEYHLRGVLQIPVNERKGLTFARGLRSILRHDPDKIMIGEIRDQETAEIAVQSALTGHLVLSTVHANNVFDVFGRFTHMGLDPYALVSALNGIWAQRLLRINCPRCSQPSQPSALELERAGLLANEPNMQFMQGMGCGDCRGTGFKGRRAVAEILKLDDELRELVIQRAPVRQLKDLAHQKGTRSLAEAAMKLVAAGATTLEEVRRVTMVS